MSVTNITSNPFPMGILKPGSSYTTASVPILTNITLSSTQLQFVRSFLVRAATTNSGNIFVCNSVANPDTTAYLNVLDIIPPGGTSYASSGALNTIDLSQIWIGASNNSDFAIAEAVWS